MSDDEAIKFSARSISTDRPDIPSLTEALECADRARYHPHVDPTAYELKVLAEALRHAKREFNAARATWATERAELLRTIEGLGGGEPF